MHLGILPKDVLYTKCLVDYFISKQSYQNIPLKVQQFVQLTILGHGIDVIEI